MLHKREMLILQPNHWLDSAGHRYSVRYPEAVYVLHAFQKKSKRGIATTKRDIDLIRQRLNEAARQRRVSQN